MVAGAFQGSRQFRGHQEVSKGSLEISVVCQRGLMRFSKGTRSSLVRFRGVSGGPRISQHFKRSSGRFREPQEGFGGLWDASKGFRGSRKVSKWFFMGLRSTKRSQVRFRKVPEGLRGLSRELQGVSRRTRRFQRRFKWSLEDSMGPQGRFKWSEGVLGMFQRDVFRSCSWYQVFSGMF